MDERYFNEVEQGEEYEELLKLDKEYEKWLDLMNIGWQEQSEEYYEQSKDME